MCDIWTKIIFRTHCCRGLGVASSNNFQQIVPKYYLFRPYNIIKNYSVGFTV
jgi:hypothetical protein